MKVGTIATRFGYSLLGAFMVMGSWSWPALAADDQTHTQHADAQKNQAGALVTIVRESTERFRDVAAAEAEGYGLLFGCVSGPDVGAMGLHYVNPQLTFDGELDPARPEIV